ncbi:MAG TPA: hypothetical protein VHD62_07750 [Opitutaceae bacterium]|nr:hypothetical protein [Opitutaceae bacterium]
MKTSLRRFVALALGWALFSNVAPAAPISIDQRIARIDALVGLSADQKARLADVFQQQESALAALGAKGDPMVRFELMEKSRADVRAVLTPEQQKTYDRTPQVNGGGLTMMAPDKRVAQLDALVGLSPDQKQVALQIFEEELESLLLFPSTQERLVQGMEVRQTTKKEVRDILTPAQRQKYDFTPQGQGGGMPVNPDNQVASLDRIVALTAEQKAAANQIFWNEVRAQIAAAGPDHPLRAFRWNNDVRDRLRALLTAEQQAKFDATSPYRRNGAR